VGECVVVFALEYKIYSLYLLSVIELQPGENFKST
jgi:hypothetical protein